MNEDRSVFVILAKAGIQRATTRGRRTGNRACKAYPANRDARMTSWILAFARMTKASKGRRSVAHCPARERSDPCNETSPVLFEGGELRLESGYPFQSLSIEPVRRRQWLQDCQCIAQVAGAPRRIERGEPPARNYGG